MALTEGQLASVALLRIGERQTIDSLDEGTPPARAAKAFFEHSAGLVLERHWWRFAKRRAALALSTETRDEWGYTYRLPADCVTPRFIDPGQRGVPADGRIPFETELDDSGAGTLLLTDQTNAVLVYTARILAPLRWSSHFADAVAWELAAQLALALPAKPGVGLEMGKKAATALQAAIALDLRGNTEDPPPDSALIRARL